eukprot:TRINITY_DN19560_c0_g3_i1.p1 TRINITY_DN19560_c0_g3~~TRINITY_DN19560_c0_g3_i1.p1  ORF type:complete len:353 (-),score=67.52 TRINITY_DN19560_c0_g3_i1:177-1235(-)
MAAEWLDAVASPDGFLYCIPDSAGAVLRVNSSTGDIDAFGELDPGAQKWSGGALGGDGKIYCAPWTHPSVLCIDPETRAISYVHPLTPDGHVLLSTEPKWRGAVLHPDTGRIFCVPWNAETVLCIDPAAGTAKCFGEVPEGESKYAGAVLAGNGMIYCVPYDGDAVLRIDPWKLEVAAMGQVGKGKRKWRGAVLGNDGCMYCIPYNALEVLKIDPNAEVDAEDAVETFGMVGGIRCKWRGGVLAPDGKIYCAPDCAAEVLCIDPETQRCETFGRLGERRWKWRGCAIGETGKVYCAPYDPFVGETLSIDIVKRTVAALPPLSCGTADGARATGLVRAGTQESGMAIMCVNFQ